MNRKPIFTLLLLFLFTTVCELKAQTIVTDTSLFPAQAITRFFLGKGVQILDYSFTGDRRQIGHFNDPSGVLGMPSGLVLSTGLVRDASRANTYGTAGVPDANTALSDDAVRDTNLEKLAVTGERLYDRCFVKIRFRTSGDSLRFRFLFASEEYPEFAPPNPVSYNDVFGFFIRGPGFPQMTNIAFLPGTSVPVSINNVNSVNNPTFFVPSFNRSDVRYSIFAFNGGTVVIPIDVRLAPCSEYTIIIAIADVGDPGRDSAIFLETGSFSGNGYSIEAFSRRLTDDGKPSAREGCLQDGAGFRFTRPDSVSAFNLGLRLNGTSVNSTDYPTIENTVRFPAGQGTVTVPLNALFDLLTETPETVIASVNDPNCPGQVLTDTLIIENRPPLSILTNGGIKTVQLCGAGTVNLTAQALNRPSGEIFYEWLNGVKSPSPDGAVSVNVSGDTEFIVRYIDVCPQVPVITDTVRVRTGFPLVLNLTRDTVICSGQSLELEAVASGGDGNYTYTWDNGLGTGGRKTITPAASAVYSVTVTDNCGSPAVSRSVRVTVLSSPSPLRLGAETTPTDTLICAGTDFTIKVVPVGGTGTYQYRWSTGEDNVSEITVRPDGLTRYTVTVSDGCTAIQRSFIPRLPGAMSVAPLITDTACIGQNQRVAARITGGKGPFRYLWRRSSDGSTFFTPEITIIGLFTPQRWALTVTDTCENVASDTFLISPQPNLRLTVPFNYATCPGQPVNVRLRASGGDGNYTFRWSDGVGLGPDKELPAENRSWQVTLSDGCGTPEERYTVTVRVIRLAEPAFQVSLPVSCTQDTVTFTYNGTLISGVTYVWDFGNLNVVSGTGQGPYRVSGAAEGRFPVQLFTITEGCTSSVFRDTLIRLAPPSADFPEQAIQCFGTQNFNFSPTPDSPNYTYSWEFGPNAVPTSSSEASPRNVRYSAPGTFEARLTVSAGNCTSSVARPITVLPEPFPPQVEVAPVCLGQTGAAIINPIIADLVYRWYDRPTGGNLISQDSVLIIDTLTRSVSYFVEAVNSVGCASVPRTEARFRVGGATSVDIEVNENEVMVPLSAITFRAVVSDTLQADFYYWTFGDGTSSTLREPVHTYSEFGTYDVSLTVTDDSTGCISSTVKESLVNIIDGTLLQVPTAFSPNDDLINDEFFVIHRLITEFNIKIYNYWGDLIFESNDVNFRWYGYDETSARARPRREVAVEGVYAYVIRAKSYSGQPIELNGNITLVR